MLMENKSWQAQEHYNRYLEIKEEMLQVSNQVNYYKHIKVDEELATLRETELYKLAKGLMFHIEQLKFSGITAEDLLLLSIGVDSAKLKKESN